MSRFNLVDEDWLPVLEKDSGKTRMVSLRTLFQEAHHYESLAGDSKTQDFALMRLLLSLAQTVYSRLDAGGDSYPSLDLDDRYKPRGEGAWDQEKRNKKLQETWKDLWKRGHFTSSVDKYLDTWKDRFYLFDDDYPFFQVRKEDIGRDRINKEKAGSVSGKNINRLISESANKIALFSPKSEEGGNKEILRADEIARWLITFQAYTGLSDKVIFGKEKYKASKGWLFDLGGIYLEGDNLFESLMLNLVLVHPEAQYQGKEEKPCWEYTSEENLKKYFSGNFVDNLAALYTNWSRAIYIDPETDVEKPFSFDIVKLPELNHGNQFLELMTLWRYNDAGENKGLFTPRKHAKNKSLWQSFGLIAFSNKEPGSENKQPGILEHFQNLRLPGEEGKEGGVLEGLEESHKNKDIRIQAVSMEDDGNATSWVPVDEICDDLRINQYIFTDDKYRDRLKRIADLAERTQTTVSKTYRIFLRDVEKIRNLQAGSLANQKLEEAYFLLDNPFKAWIASIEPKGSMLKKEKEWDDYLKGLLRREAKKIMEEASPRDYKGVVVKAKGTSEGERILNIATAYNSFSYFLNRN